MKDIITCDALKKTVGNKKIMAVHHCKRENAVQGQPGTASSLVWSIFESMPSVDELIMVEIYLGEVVLIMKDSPTFEEMEAGTDAVRNVSPMGVYVHGLVFNDEDYESVKQIKA